jgi:hypothetical protein
MTLQNKLRIFVIAGPMLLAGLTSVAMDAAAAGSHTGNRAPAPRGATATNKGFSHIDVVNQNKATPSVKTDKLCPGHHCHATHGDY